MSVNEEIAEYPKMVYPGGASVHFNNAGSGIIVNNAEEEAEIMNHKSDTEAKAETKNWDNK